MRRANTAITLLCLFFFLVFTIALLVNLHYPSLILAGESSVGTWMSGVLLVTSATLSLVIGMRTRWYPWLLAAAFFIILSIDERFMIHEQLKERIIFSFHTTSRWMYELPVILGACAGALFVCILWKFISGISRSLLVCTATLGVASVSIDIFSASVLLEECFKLVAELLMACALLKKLDE